MRADPANPCDAQPDATREAETRRAMLRIIGPTVAVAIALAVLWGVLFSAFLRGDAAPTATSSAHAGHHPPPAAQPSSDFFTNFGAYMPRIHCVTTAQGTPDWPWIIALIVLSAGVILAYLRIYVFWCRAYLAEEARDRNAKLMDLAQIFLWCAVCGYASSLLMFVWPAYRLVACCLVVLNIWSWRFVRNINSFGVTFSAQRFRRLAETDALTGLLNRDAFLRHIRRLTDHRTGATANFAVMYVDLDRFKSVNDTLGHDAGDLLLRQIAERLRQLGATGSSTGAVHVARIGGDEFAVLAESIDDPDEAAGMAKALMRLLEPHFQLADRRIHAAASIGIRLADGRTGPDELLRDADIAMYEAKASGRNRILLYDDSMQRRIAHRMRIEHDLRHAIGRNELELHYQPIVSFETTAPVGVEALIRWNHSKLGLIPPDDFVPAAEDTGLMLTIGKWVLAEACGALRRLHDETGIRDLSMSVNVAGSQVRDPTFVSETLATIDSAGVPRRCVHLEITESAIAGDADAVNRPLTDLRSAGVMIDLDDFGAGLSSLSALHQLPLDRLKLDRSFTHNMNTRRDFTAVTHAVLALARNINLEVVAEGVEHPDQAATLLALDCQYAQGFLFGKPMSCRAITAWLRGANRALVEAM